MWEMKNFKMDKYEKAQAEAKRYLANADELLAKSGSKSGFYKDSKYVKAAGEMAWKGILMALDPLHPPVEYVSKKNRFARKSVQSYKSILGGAFPVVEQYNSAYSSLHIAMGYDGNTNVTNKKIGWQDAKNLINWAKENYPKQNLIGVSSTKKLCKTCGRGFSPERRNIVNCKKCRK